MIEVKDVVGYEGLYIIDNLSNVVSLPKIQGRYIHNGYKVLTKKVNKLGYVVVSLTKDGNTKTCLLHRLVAKAFIKNPNNFPTVNHKNGIKSDNRIENLEWCTKQQNTKHAFDNNLGGFKSRSLNNFNKWNDEHGYKSVVISNGVEEHSFSCTRDAAVFLKTEIDEITRAIRKSQRHKGWQVFGEKKSII